MSPRVACRDDQFAHEAPSLIEFSDQCIELYIFVVVPFRRNAPGNLTELGTTQAFFHAIEPRFERIDARDVPINAVATIKPAQRGVGEIPFARIEAESLIDDHRLIARTAGLQKKNGLPPIGVACKPLRPRWNEPRIAKLRASGASWREVCEKTGLSKGTAQRAVHSLPKKVSLPKKGISAAAASD